MLGVSLCAGCLSSVGTPSVLGVVGQLEGFPVCQVPRARCLLYVVRCQQDEYVCSCQYKTESCTSHFLLDNEIFLTSSAEHISTITTE